MREGQRGPCDLDDSADRLGLPWTSGGGSSAPPVGPARRCRRGALASCAPAQVSGAGRAWEGTSFFPSHKLHLDAESGAVRRWHVSPGTVQKAMKRSVRRACIARPASVHTLRHSFASHRLQDGVDIRCTQALMGHKSVETTMIYAHGNDDECPGFSEPSGRHVSHPSRARGVGARPAITRTPSCLRQRGRVVGKRRRAARGE